MYTGSIPVLASNKINDLRHPTSPSLPFLKQPLKLSRFGLASFHLISCLLSARGPLDVFDDLLARALRCLSHRPLLSGYDEPETLSYQIPLIGPIRADVRQFVIAVLNVMTTCPITARTRTDLHLHMDVECRKTCRSPEVSRVTTRKKEVVPDFRPVCSLVKMDQGFI